MRLSQLMKEPMQLAHIFSHSILYAEFDSLSSRVQFPQIFPLSAPKQTVDIIVVRINMRLPSHLLTYINIAMQFCFYPDTDVYKHCILSSFRVQ